MKQFTAAAQAAIEDGSARIGAAVEIATGDPVRVWSGEGSLPLGGEHFTGLSHREIGIAARGSLGGLAQNITLTLSGIDPEVLELLDAADLRSAPVAITTLISDSTGRTILDSFVHRRGRVDRVPVEETAGGTATITLEVESAAKGLGRRTGRLRSDADQRLIKPTDGSMRQVTYAPEKKLYWGGERPSRAGSSLGGGGGGGSGPSLVP